MLNTSPTAAHQQRGTMDRKIQKFSGASCYDANYQRAVVKKIKCEKTSNSRSSKSYTCFQKKSSPARYHSLMEESQPQVVHPVSPSSASLVLEAMPRRRFPRPSMSMHFFRFDQRLLRCVLYFCRDTDRHRSCTLWPISGDCGARLGNLGHVDTYTSMTNVLLHNQELCVELS